MTVQPSLPALAAPARPTSLRPGRVFLAGLLLASLALSPTAAQSAEPAPGQSLVTDGALRGTRLQMHGDLLGGYFNDRALYETAGREAQSFKLGRALLGISAEHPSGWGGVVEYNLAPDEVKHKAGDMAYVDYYKNLGTDLLYYGDFAARNLYLSWRSPQDRLLVRAGRMVNLQGFDLEELPYAHRHDSPHALFLDKEILNGLALRASLPWLTAEVAALSGRGRPDSDYNWYLQGAGDPNTKDNSSPALEARLRLHWRDAIELVASAHRNKTGSAPGSLFSGKHNDDRYALGLIARTPALSSWYDGATLFAQLSRYQVGLTEDGTQGSHTPLQSLDIDKDGWFVTLSQKFFGRLAVHLSYEEIDRMDSKVWSDIAVFDPNSPAFASTEESWIIAADYALSEAVTLSGFYRSMDFDYSPVSGISAASYADEGVDKFGVTLRVKF